MFYTMVHDVHENCSFCSFCSFCSDFRGISLNLGHTAFPCVLIMCIFVRILNFLLINYCDYFISITVRITYTSFAGISYTRRRIKVHKTHEYTSMVFLQVTGFWIC